MDARDGMCLCCWVRGGYAFLCMLFTPSQHSPITLATLLQLSHNSRATSCNSHATLTQHSCNYLATLMQLSRNSLATSNSHYASLRQHYRSAYTSLHSLRYALPSTHACL